MLKKQKWQLSTFLNFRIEVIFIISSYNKTKEIIDKYDFIFKKSFGQNFLIDTNIIGKIVTCSDVTTDDVVIEIGPGIGSLTEVIARAAHKVIAIEIDKKLIPVLEDTLKDLNNVIIINEDILKVDLCELIEKYSDGKQVKIIANLPYYITTPIIMSVLENRIPVKSLTVMIQKEVAQRMSATQSTKEYGSLSIAVAYYADAKMVINVPGSCFVPKPNVDSTVIKLDILGTPRVKVDDDKLFFKLVKAGFFQRRKTLLNCLTNYTQLEINKEQATELLTKCDLNLKARGESLTLQQYADLSNNYLSIINN